VTGAACALLLGAALAPAALTQPAAAQVWAAPAGVKIFPSSGPGSSAAAAITAAGGEYEGFQLGLSGGGKRAASVSWESGSSDLLVRNSALHRVGFVRVTRPTSGLGGRKGLYPDPLIPVGFGRATSVPAGSSAFYVLVHVPYGTPAGTYAGSLRIVNGAEQARVPVSLRVWDFGWQRLSTRTAFAVNMRNIITSIKGSGVPIYRGDHMKVILGNFYRMMQQHGLTPMMPNVIPRVTGSGRIDTDRFAQDLAPFLSAKGLDLPDAQAPWLNWYPQKSWRHALRSGKLRSYLTSLFRVYAANGWQDKAYVFIQDEPGSTSEERAAERFARAAHAASAKAGFRVRFLLTDDPRPRAVTVHPANRFLFDDVDIWCTRYYYFFGRVPALRAQQRRGKEVWWYPYHNRHCGKLPDFAVEEPLADQRIWGWLMEKWGVDGMLYWGINRWGDPSTGSGWRHPYRNALSYRNRAGRVSNGEASLVYPGYVPELGLKDPYAAPVSSLRLEALRDGFEDREYARLAAGSATKGPRFVDAVMGKVTWFPYKVRFGHCLKFPKYVTAASAFDKARCQLAEHIELYGAK